MSSPTIISLTQLNSITAWPFNKTRMFWTHSHPKPIFWFPMPGIFLLKHLHDFLYHFLEISAQRLSYDWVLLWPPSIPYLLLSSRTEELGMLQSVKSQRVRHDLATEQQVAGRGIYSVHVILNCHRSVRLWGWYYNFSPSIALQRLSACPGSQSRK